MLRSCCSGSKVPELMISCEYIRILKYCMYISTAERKTIAFYKLFWMTQKWRLLEANRERNWSAKPFTAATCHVTFRFLSKIINLYPIICIGIPNVNEKWQHRIGVDGETHIFHQQSNNLLVCSQIPYRLGLEAWLKLGKFWNETFHLLLNSKKSFCW